MPFTPVSGNGGAVKISTTSVGEVLDWRIAKKAVVTKFASSESNGYKKSVAGSKDSACTFNGKWDSLADAPFDVGDSLTLVLQLMSGKSFTYPCVVASLDITTNMDTGEPIGFSCVAENNGAWTEPSFA